MHDDPAEPGIAHGGRLNAARRRFPDAPEPIIDLSTGINPIGYPIPALPASAFSRLPEPEAVAALEQAAALAYGVGNAASVVVAPGTQLLIGLLPRLCPAARVSVVGPTYNEHAFAWSAAGATVEQVDSLAAADPRQTVVLCNPNNPDGRRWRRAALLEFADRAARQGGHLVVDEAFCDTEPAELSLAPAVPHPALTVLRSFGKAYGLAGLRLGFALVEPRRAHLLHAALGPWRVSGPAIAIGTPALADRAWLAAATERLARESRALDGCLQRAGLAVIGGTLLFRLAATDHASAIEQRLGRAGILVRSFTDHPTWLRFGLPGDADAWRRLQAAL